MRQRHADTGVKVDISARMQVGNRKRQKAETLNIIDKKNKTNSTRKNKVEREPAITALLAKLVRPSLIIILLET